MKDEAWKIMLFGIGMGVVTGIGICVSLLRLTPVHLCF